jgi:hypothetical protein
LDGLECPREDPNKNDDGLSRFRSRAFRGELS